MQKYEVKLQIYDLSNGSIKHLAPQFNLDIEGIWHTSVDVYGREHFFMGGIVQAPSGTQKTGKHVKTIELGVTDVEENLFFEFLEMMNVRFNQNTYNLMKNNCNHFSNELSKFLVNKQIPDYILLLPEIVRRSPFYSTFLQMFGITDEDIEEIKDVKEIDEIEENNDDL